MRTPLINALDLATDGRLPYLVEQAHVPATELPVTDETVYEVVARELAEREAGRPPRPCTVYPWCVEVDTHDDHTGPEFLVRSYDEDTEPLVWACVGHLGDSLPYVGLNGADLSPEQAREKARELREMADQVEAMADQAEVARALTNLRKARETAYSGFAEVLTIMESAIVRDGANPVEVGERVLELLQQAHDESTGDTR